MNDRYSKVRLIHVIEAINRLPNDGTRQAMFRELRECDRETRYYTLADGRVDAEKNRLKERAK